MKKFILGTLVLLHSSTYSQFNSYFYKKCIFGSAALSASWAQCWGFTKISNSLIKNPEANLQVNALIGINFFYGIIEPLVDAESMMEEMGVQSNDSFLEVIIKGFKAGLFRNPLTSGMRVIKKLNENIVGKEFKPVKSLETFNSVIGAQKAKDQLQTIVNFIKHPERTKRLGSKMPHGVLLTGLPGTGKTLLAKAVAGESKASFFYASGSEFTEIFVGAGAARIRQLFKEARKNAPSIIFIDEIDSFAQKRGSRSMHSENEQTLNQLLTELDGFNSRSEQVIVIAATNRSESLDEAVLRPGRFDREIYVSLPNQDERKEILNLHTQNLTLADDIDFDILAEKTYNFAGADLANLANQASILATEENSSSITMDHFLRMYTVLRKEMASRQPLINGTIPQERFSSIIGAKEAKNEFASLVDFLKDPEKNKSLGGRIQNGVLLTGEPGTGKTLLAKALAGETQCSFFSLSGSDIVSKWVGEGADRIRYLFKKAREHAPSIIFIDEIDSIGGKRNNINVRRHSDYDVTLNQLLVEMDGFKNNDKPVIVIAATNRPDSLDTALLRPGRFDRTIYVGLPDLETRIKILEHYASSIKTEATINFKLIAKQCTGYSPAQLENLVNQAALIATQEGAQYVNESHFQKAHDLITLGDVNTSVIMDEQQKRITAFHEAGHALACILASHKPHVVNKITIIPRSMALGLTSFYTPEDKYAYSQEEMFGMLQAALGGRIAEEIEFGLVSTGPRNDLERATDIARTMVCQYGMSKEVGLFSYDPSKHTYSSHTMQAVDQAVINLLNEAYAKTYDLIKNNRDKLAGLAQALLDKETIYEEEIYAIVGR